MRSARAFAIWEHDLSLVSGLDATAHAAEGLYAHDGNPVMPLMADD
jgi:maleylacetate reductase